jgi:rRNA maturation endonuclease Nob1
VIQLQDIDFDRGILRIEHLKTRLQATCPGCESRLPRKNSFCRGCGVRVEAVVTKEKDHKRMTESPLDEETLGTARILF